MIAILVFLLIFKINFIQALTPTFDRLNENVSAIIGNTVVLPCYINNLGDHKVAWIKVGNTDIIAIGDFRVTNDDRIRVQHTYVSDWSLMIQQVNEDDTGEYICQVNTEPQIIKKINLQVLMPPKLIEDKSSKTHTDPINEGDTLSLYCHFDGSPTPKVSWYFRKRLNNANRNEELIVRSNQKSRKHAHSAAIHEGNSLIIENVNRNNSGYYECIANNSVPPAASRKIKAIIEFAPELQTTANRLERQLGTDAIFECKIRANPLTNHYWMKDGRVIESNTELTNEVNKYDLNVNTNSNEFLTISSLVIKNITKTDYGYYECYAVNKFKTVKTTVELKELLVTKKLANTQNNKNSQEVVATRRMHNKKLNYTTSINKNENYYDAEINRFNLFNSGTVGSRAVTVHVTRELLLLIFTLSFVFV